MMSFGYAPRGWAQCNGQTLSIAQNQALYSLIGITYGGNGTTSFLLPNLQGRVPIHTSNTGAHPLGQPGGEQGHTLTLQETLTHNHAAYGSVVNGNAPAPGGSYLGAAAGFYGPLSTLTPLQAQTIANDGGSQPHENRQPYLTVNFCICLNGIYPSRP